MSKRVLVIDDEEAVRKSFALALEDTDYEVHLADGGEKGLEMNNEAHYDLIYLDLKMPGINGVDTLRAIRKIDKDVPIYIVTAFHKEFLEQLKSVAKDGVDFELLHKPIGMDQIIEVTNAILKNG